MEKIENTITEGVYFEIICKPLDNEEYVPANRSRWEWHRFLDNGSNESIPINKNDTSVYKNTTDNVLFIKHTTPKDAGMYKCMVDNLNGIDYRIVSLKIRGLILEKKLNFWSFFGHEIFCIKNEF